MDLSGWIGSISGGIALLTLLTKTGRRWVMGYFARRKQRAAIPGTLIKIDERLSKIESQNLPNAGNSIYDRIKRIDRIVQINNSRVLSIQDRAPTAIYECDASGRTLIVNQKLCEIFGMSSEAMLAHHGMGWLNQIDGQKQRERVAQEWSHSLEYGVPYKTDYTIRGGIKVNTTADPILSETGELLGFRGMLWVDGGVHSEIETEG